MEDGDYVAPLQTPQEEVLDPNNQPMDGFQRRLTGFFAGSNRARSKPPLRRVAGGRGKGQHRKDEREERKEP
jgi:hypothetical protein